jgi:hypothetical protein
LTKEQEEMSLKPINRHQECSTKRERKSLVVELQKREEERKKEKGCHQQPCCCMQLLPYVAMRDGS